MWNLAGIEPETLDYVKMQITSPNYELRPEIIESTYYLYHYTHDAKYLAMGRTYLDGLVKYCRTDEAYAALADVRSKQKKDAMESFFFAETLKYLYLLFAPESTLEFDSVIFNTEAHPMKRSLGVKRVRESRQSAKIRSLQGPKCRVSEEGFVSIREVVGIGDGWYLD